MCCVITIELIIYVGLLKFLTKRGMSFGKALLCVIAAAIAFNIFVH